MRVKVRWNLFLIDSIIYLLIYVFLLVMFPDGVGVLGLRRCLIIGLICFGCLCLERGIFRIYQQIWRCESFRLPLVLRGGRQRVPGIRHFDALFKAEHASLYVRRDDSHFGFNLLHGNQAPVSDGVPKARQRK
jgi:hypothetical protein